MGLKLRKLEKTRIKVSVGHLRLVEICAFKTWETSFVRLYCVNRRALCMTFSKK